MRDDTQARRTDPMHDGAGNPRPDRRRFGLRIALPITVLALLVSACPAGPSTPSIPSDQEDAVGADGTGTSGDDAGGPAGDGDGADTDTGSGSGSGDSSQEDTPVLDGAQYAEKVDEACAAAGADVEDLLAALAELDPAAPYEPAHDALDDMTRSLTWEVDAATEDTANGLRGATRDMRGAVEDLGEAAAAGDDAAYTERYAELRAGAEEFLSLTPDAARPSCEAFLGG